LPNRPSGGAPGVRACRHGSWQRACRNGAAAVFAVSGVIGCLRPLPAQETCGPVPRFCGVGGHNGGRQHAVEGHSNVLIFSVPALGVSDSRGQVPHDSMAERGAARRMRTVSERSPCACRPSLQPAGACRPSGSLTLE